MSYLCDPLLYIKQQCNDVLYYNDIMFYIIDDNSADCPDAEV